MTTGLGYPYFVTWFTLGPVEIFSFRTISLLHPRNPNWLNFRRNFYIDNVPWWVTLIPQRFEPLTQAVVQEGPAGKGKDVLPMVGLEVVTIETFVCATITRGATWLAIFCSHLFPLPQHDQNIYIPSQFSPSHSLIFFSMWHQTRPLQLDQQFDELGSFPQMGVRSYAVPSLFEHEYTCSVRLSFW